MKAKGKRWTRDQIVTYCKKFCAKREVTATKGVKRAIEKHIRKSSKAPPGWNEAYRKAKLRASGVTGGIEKKVKKSKFKGGWFMVLLIVLPIVIIGLIFWLWLGGDVDLPPDDEDFKP